MNSLPENVDLSDKTGDKKKRNSLIAPKGKVYATEEAALSALNACDSSDELDPDENYLSISKNIRVARYVLLLIIVLLTFMLIMNYSNVINVTGIREFFFSFIDDAPVFRPLSVVNAGLSEYDEICVYKNYVAALNSNSFELYKTDGEKVFIDRRDDNESVMSASDRYVVVYGIDENYLTVYNAIDTVKEMTFDSSIYIADINNAGNLAVLTHAASTPSLVSVYDKTFEEVFQWTSADKYTVCLELTDHNTVIIASVNSVGGDMVTYLNLYDVNVTSPLNSLSFDDTVPLKINPTKNGFNLVCNDKIMFFDSNGAQVATSLLTSYGMNVTKIASNGTYTAVNVSLTSGIEKSSTLVFDENGTLICKHQSDSSITDIAMSDDEFFVLYPDKLLSIDVKTGKTNEDLLNDTYRRILVYAGNRVLLVSDYQTVSFK